MLKFNQEKGLSALAALLANPTIAAPVQHAPIEVAQAPSVQHAPIHKRSCADIIEEAGEIEYHELLIDDASGISCE